jgi:hypothetical protein
MLAGTEKKVIEKKVTPAQETDARLTAAYEAATDEDRQRVNDLVRRAVGAPPGADLATITPGMAAILFHDHNHQNRDWQYAKSLEYEAQLQSNNWDFTNATLGFADNGQLIDGQHRLAALALSGRTIVFVIVLGLDIKIVEVIDTGMRRVAASAVHILRHKDMADATIKTDIVRKADIFIAKATQKAPVLANNTRKIGQAVQDNESRIEEAIGIGLEATVNIAKPTLKLRQAQVLAYVLLSCDWPKAVVLDDLTRFQTGQEVGEHTPFFVAAKILERETRGTAPALNAVLAVAVKAFQLHQAGIKAIKSAPLRDVMKLKNYPSPVYVDPTRPVA